MEYTRTEMVWLLAGWVLWMCDPCSLSVLSSENLPQAIITLNFLITFKRRAPHFHFVRGPANYNNKSDYNDNRDYYLKKKKTELRTWADLKTEECQYCLLLHPLHPQFSRPSNRGLCSTLSIAFRIVCLEHRPHHSI